MKVQSANLLRSILPLLLLLAQPILPAFTQETEDPSDPESEIVKTQYTVLDESSQRYRSFWDAKSGEIRFI